jgi:hypothetical protein
MSLTIVGLDPSFSSFGVVHAQNQFGSWTDISSRRFCTEPGWSPKVRADQLLAQIHAFIPPFHTTTSHMFVVEGPSFGSALAGALWDAGYLMRCIDELAAEFGAALYIVPPATLKKFVTGKGNTPKADMNLIVYKKWKVEFEDDPGRDKLFAYCLYRYGLALANGEIEHTPPPLRGMGKDGKARTRAAAKTKLAV